MSRLHLLPVVRIVDTMCILCVQGNKEVKVLSLSADDATDRREILRYATLCVMLVCYSCFPRVFCLILVTTIWQTIVQLHVTVHLEQFAV